MLPDPHLAAAIAQSRFVIRHSDLVRHSAFAIAKLIPDPSSLIPLFAGTGCVSGYNPM